MIDAEAELGRRVQEFLAAHPPAQTDRDRFLRARFEAGLAWVDYPVGLGGLDLDNSVQPAVDAAFAAAGAPDNKPQSNVIGLGMAAPTLLQWATREQQERWLPPLWTGEEVWCQLFSEPGAGSDLAAVGASARRDGEDWVVNGQKVWTSLAHTSRWALLLVRTDPTVPKHQGLTYFVVDMQSPGIDVRALRQLTGEAEFNEVYLDDVRVPDAQRLGAVGEGWRVTQTTLMNERVAIGGSVGSRETGPVADLISMWREARADRPELLDDVTRLWVDAEALRLASALSAQAAERGTPGPEGSGLKLAFAQLAQASSSLTLDVQGPQALRYDDWTEHRPDLTTPPDRVPGYWYLRTRANSIEGGTSEVMRNIIAERVLGLPAEPRVDKDIAWKDIPK
ncbi:acyl-CoA dehydrogenase family protein [Nocardioides sp.]|uniref:acyl-CoA dehydrogenase family protein n=1 Tax=Nocardioides sp. TaxID=35761 RepID=UPI0026394342|nr:acyl-CoA dehydrogenase family protein [Nocardioides sp.]MDI6909229.1 acyl-CoA dehydrogenase family protein [Nocardioides sp.]